MQSIVLKGAQFKFFRTLLKAKVNFILWSAPKPFKINGFPQFLKLRATFLYSVKLPHAFSIIAAELSMQRRCA